MPPLNPWHSDLTIAWAAQVSFPQLCSSVLAYNENKAAIATFRHVTQNSDLKPLKNLPEEMILKIGDKLRDSGFRAYMKDWIDIQQCFRKECRISKHTTEKEFNEGAQWTVDQGLSIEYDLEDYFDDDIDDVWHRRHQSVLNEMSFEFNMGSRSKFKTAAWTFSQEFGIFPYVLATKDFVDDGTIDSVDARAYLIIPVADAPVESSPGYQSAGFFVNSRLDLSILKDLSPEQSKKFKIAAQVLKLHPYHEEEDESIYVDKDKPNQKIVASNGFDPVEIEEAESTNFATGSHEAGPHPVTPLIKLKPKTSVNRPFEPRLRIFGCMELEAFIPGE